MEFCDLKKFSTYMRLLKNKEIYFYGASRMGKIISELLPVEISGFIDGNNSNKLFLGKKVHAIDELRDRNKENIMIVISSSYVKEIMEVLDKNGYIENETYIDGSIFYEFYKLSEDKESLSNFRNMYWNSRVKDIENRYVESVEDKNILNALIQEIKPRKIFEFGCGTGRLIDVFEKNHINYVVGQDIAEEAIKQCKIKYSEYFFTIGNLDDVYKEHGEFDITICNRVLSAIPHDEIDSVVKKISKMSKAIFINEYQKEEFNGESSYFFLHADIVSKFEEAGFKVCKEIKGTGYTIFYLVK